MQIAKVGVLLVVTNEEKYIPLFSKSFLEQTYKNCQLYVLDNNCVDNSIPLLEKKVPNCTIIKLNDTTGFANGNNILAKAAIKDNCDFLFILNPDIELDSLCIESLVALISTDKRIGAVAPIMFYGLEDRLLNRIQSYADFIDFSKRRVVSKYGSMLFNEIDPPEVLDVNVVSGGITFIRSEVVQNIGLFEEQYYIYGEEADLAMRFKENNLLMKVTSRAKVWHHHDWSPKNKSKHYFSYYYMNRSQVLYFKKFKLYYSLSRFLIKEFSQFPLKIRWSLRIADFRLFRLYYLGILHGLLGKTGKSSLNFNSND